jgi:murein DD-endopeptidase MepM/ murein hydrolase activator NlpD
MKVISQRSIVCSLTSILPLSIWFGWLLAASGGAIASSIESEGPLVAQASLCQEPALSRLTPHTIASGETLESIAQRYNLIPATLQGFNPVLRSGSAPVGAEIVIPPYNGVQVNAPAGATWRQLAQTYGVRADAIFEINGCQDTVPSVVFVPGVNWSPTAATGPAPSDAPANNPLNGYPLPAIADVVTSYGWQLNPTTNEFVFESGVNLQAESGTPVLAAGAGTVAFAGTEGTYGNLVVVNHAQGLQTRYAQLGTVTVQVGQQISAGMQLGVVGTLESSPSFLHFEVRSNSNLGWVAQDPGSYIPDIRSADQIRRRPQPESN